MTEGCRSGECVEANSAAVSNGLPYLILIITLVLCSILLATIALIIIVVVTRQRRKRRDSLEDTAISYDDLAKPDMTTMGVQPDLRTLELKGNHRGFLPFAPVPPRRFGPQGPFDAQRRLIAVPEEEGSADEGRHSKIDLLSFPTYEYDNTTLSDLDGENDIDPDDDIQHGASAANMRHPQTVGKKPSKQRAHPTHET